MLVFVLKKKSILSSHQYLLNDVGMKLLMKVHWVSMNAE